MKYRYVKICTLLCLLLFPLVVLADNTANWRLSPEGLGPIHIGMTLKQIAALTKSELTSTQPDSHEDKSCFITALKDTNLSGVSFMVSYNKVVRVDVSTKKFPTSRGVRIGDTEEKVKKLYGPKLLVEKHHYDDKGHYLTYLDKAKNLSIRFETNGKIITLMYAGKVEQVQYVEDCL